MSRTRQVAGGGRAVEVEPERLGRWFTSFGERNGGIADVSGGDVLEVRADNGTTATVQVPGVGSVAELIAHAETPRRLGLVLVRLGAHSVGIATGTTVEVTRTNRHNVHGRNAAGGWSQQRFARRRDKQAREALQRAARDIAEVVLPEVSKLDSVVLAGDKRAVDELREERQLAPLFAKAGDRVIDIGEPRRAVLDEVLHRARAVEIIVRDPT